MKTLTDVMINGYSHDAIIESFMIECRDEQRDVIWVDKENGIAKCHGDARCVTIFVKDSDDSTKITAIEICASSIKKLYQGITEIEKQTSEESID